MYCLFDSIASRYALDGPGSIPGGGRDFHRLSIPALEPTQLLVKEVQLHFTGRKAAGAWRWLPTLSSAEVKERVELYIYSPFRDCSRVEILF
jgi:hypothetical protein